MSMNPNNIGEQRGFAQKAIQRRFIIGVGEANANHTCALSALRVGN